MIQETYYNFNNIMKEYNEKDYVLIACHNFLHDIDKIYGGLNAEMTKFKNYDIIINEDKKPQEYEFKRKENENEK